MLQRNELKVHEEEKCSQHIVKCEHCSKEFIFGVLTVHTEKCPKMQVSCEGITREACISSSGGQFCSCCEVRESKSSTTNKLVRKSFTKQRNPPKQTPNVAVRKMVSSLKCSCPLLERGCEWLGTLKDLETHLDTCDYVGDKCN